MDWINLSEKILPFVKKYKYVILVLFLGILLMLIPSRKEEPAVQTQQTAAVTTKSPAEELEEILSKIEGVGKVRVLLTEASGPETVYQTDEDRSDTGSLRVETVIVTDGSRGQNGLIKRVDPPSYLGAVVVCQGADRPSIQLAIVEAVSNVTAIPSDRITVLKMK